MEEIKKKEIVIDSLNIDFGCTRRRDRDRDRDRDNGTIRPDLNVANLDKEEIEKRVKYSF